MKVLLAVEGNGLRLDLALLHVDLVSAEHDGNVLANTDQVTYRLLELILRLKKFPLDLIPFSPSPPIIHPEVWAKHTVPVGNILVGDTAGNVEHDNTALAVDVVSITETAKLLLTSGVPNIELNLAEVLER